MDKENNILIVLDSDLIYDVLSLETTIRENFGVIRNMLILIEVMLVTNNEKAIAQMKAFDIVALLFHIMHESSELSYLALTCLAILAKQEFFKYKIIMRN